MRAPGDAALRQASLRGALAPAWSAIQTAAQARRSRLSGP